MSARLKQLLTQQADQQAARSKILAGVEARGGRDLTGDETRRFEDIGAILKDLGELIEHERSEIRRAGRDNPDLARISRPTRHAHMGGSGVAGDGDWAERVSGMLTETRAIVTGGSLEVPDVIRESVIEKARATRLLDIIVDRESLGEGVQFRYFVEHTRTTAADWVEDGDTKPVSTYTVTPVSGEATTLAHLSEQLPIALLRDHKQIVKFLERSLAEGLADALENTIVNGTGTAPDQRGILATAGIQTQAYVTSVPLTIRRAIRKAQETNESPTHLLVNPATAETLDTILQTSGNDFLLDGFQNSPAGSGNILGDFTRIVSNSVPDATALLLDASQLRLFVREDARLDLDFSGPELFAKNRFQARYEGTYGFGILRPSSVIAVSLTAGP